MLTIKEKDGVRTLMLDGYPAEVGDRVWDSYYTIWRTITEINYDRGEVVFDIKNPHFHIGSLNHMFWQPPERPPKPKKKVKKWQWLYTLDSKSPKDMSITTDRFSSREDAGAQHKWSKLRLIGPCLESEIEVEE